MNISSLTNPTTASPTLNNLPQGTLHSHPQETKTTSPKPENAESPRDKHQTALQLVNRTLTMAYEKISSRGQTAAGQTAAGQAATKNYAAVEPLTATKVANNILGFIERRLQMDVANGATQEQLQSRLEAGLSGFKKGFAEASEQLKALSMLTPEITADIGKTYDLVLKGIDALHSKFITATEQPATEVTPAPVTPPKASLHLPDVLPTTHKANQTNGNYEYARASEFSFELTTAEGDKVTIRANSSEGLSIHGNNTSASSSQASSWSVDGDLNDNEINAINDLLDNVDKLAGQFFSGNLDEAFNKVLTLGYDETQIGGYALHLSQVEIQQVSTAYNEFAPQEADDSSNKTPALATQLLPIGKFIKDLLATLDQASLFGEPQKLLNETSANLIGKDDAEQSKRFTDFINKMLGLNLVKPGVEANMGRTNAGT